MIVNRSIKSLFDIFQTEATTRSAQVNFRQTFASRSVLWLKPWGLTPVADEDTFVGDTDIWFSAPAQVSEAAGTLLSEHPLFFFCCFLL